VETQVEPPGATPPPGALARAIAWSKAKVRWATDWALGARETHTSVDVGFRIADRDKRVAASVLAGGVAYRFFFWLLALSLLISGALGLVGGSRVQDSLRDQDAGPALVEIVGEASDHSQTADW